MDKYVLFNSEARYTAPGDSEENFLYRLLQLPLYANLRSSTEVSHNYTRDTSNKTTSFIHSRITT